MARNSVTGCFQDIEISFSIDVDCIRMNLRNLVAAEKQMRVMYQKQPTSGLANWKQFQLANHPVSLRLPTEVLEAYRITFFVDDAEPISARVEKVLSELETSTVLPEKHLPEEIADIEPVDIHNQVDVHTYEDPEVEAVNQVETTPNLPGIQLSPTTSNNADTDDFGEVEPIAADQLETTDDLPEIPPLAATTSDADSDVPEASEFVAAEQIEATHDLPEIDPSKQTHRERPNSPLETDAHPELSHTATQLSTIRKVKPELPNVGSHSEFKISVPSLPPSALAAQRKLQISGTQESTKISRKSKQKENGFFGQIVRTLKGGKTGKAYYQEIGEEIQNEFQDQLSKLERDYNEGYGLNLFSWKPETLCEEETAIFLLNLMANEIIAWQKQTGRATPKNGGIVETLAEVDSLLRQTLRQTRGISTPSPTLFPNLLAESVRDLEKIRNECDAYLQRFTSKLIEQEKKHASKIEILSFRKFLTEFIRDYLFAEISKNTQGNALPERLNWFLELVDSEVMPIEIGKTKVLSSHHKVKDARPSECEPGTIVEVITPGLQSKDGKRVNQMAVVIEAE